MRCSESFLFAHDVRYLFTQRNQEVCIDTLFKKTKKTYCLYASVSKKMSSIENTVMNSILYVLIPGCIHLFKYQNIKYPLAKYKC